MPETPDAALLLIGAPGAGKTSVMEKLGTLLEINDVPHGKLESEALSEGWPPLAAEDWLPQLRAVIELQKRTGRRLFLLTVTTETQQQLDEIKLALDVSLTITLCLTVSQGEAANRIAEREPDSWPGKPRLIAHARRLARTIPALNGIDAQLGTEGRDPATVAAEILALPQVQALLEKQS